MKLGHLGQQRGDDTPVHSRGFPGISYLDEVGCRHPPLLKVLLTVLLLHLQGKARAQDALGEEAWLGEGSRGGQPKEKVSIPALLSSPRPIHAAGSAPRSLSPRLGDPKCRGTHSRQGKEGDA